MNQVEAELNVWVHVAVIKLTDSVSPFFVREMLNSPDRYRQSQTHTHGVGNQGLGLTRMITITFPIPSAAEQVQIVRRVRELLSLAGAIADSLTGRTEHLRQLNQSILAKAFRGELVPQDPTDEPASVLLERIRTAREAAAEPKRPSKRPRKPKAAP